MTRHRHNEGGSVFSGEDSGMNTPMPASANGTTNGSPAGGEQEVEMKGKEISPPTFGEPGFGGLSLKEGLASGGEPMRQRHSLDGYFSGNMTPEQQARARQQVRADLAGIDHRALKGPLRDLMSNPNYAGEVPGSLYTANGNTSSSSETEGGSLRPPIGPRRRSSSLTLPSPSPPWDSNMRSSAAGAIQAAMNNSFLQHQQQQQQLQQQAKMPPPSVNAAASKSAKGKGLPARSRTLRRDGSGLTVSPQEAFLDYPNVEAAISSGSTAAPGMGVHSVFAPDPPGLGEALAGDGLKSTPTPFSMEKSAPVVTASEDGSSFAVSKASKSSAAMRDDTPSLTGGTSTSSRDDSTVPSPSTGAGANLAIPPSSAQATQKPGSSSREGFRGLASSSSSDMRSYGSGMSLLKAESTTSTPDEEDDDERPFPATKNQPYRFSNVSASSSEEEAKGFAKGLMPPGRRPLAGRRTPGSFGGYGYIPGSADSGMSYQEEAPTPMTETTDEGEQDQDRPLAFHGVTSREEVKEEAGSNDEGSDSPSIRSSAQAVRMRQSSSAGANTPPARSKPTPAKRSSAGVSDGSEEDEEGDEEDSDYGASSARSKRRRARLASNSERRQSKATPASTTSLTERTFPTNRSGMSICDYVSPLTNDYCGTEFHRLYDLTRHRETIHAKDEAKAIREKKLTLEQCVVLGKEVDPKTSSATVEWKCEGRNGCGSVFSVSIAAKERIKYTTDTHLQHHSARTLYFDIKEFVIIKAYTRYIMARGIALAATRTRKAAVAAHEHLARRGGSGDRSCAPAPRTRCAPAVRRYQ